MKRRKTRKRKIKYKEVTFKLSSKQKKSLINYCNARRTTPTKLIKKLIRPYITHYAKSVPEEFYATENQLDLFDDKDTQQRIFFKETD